jgi:putative transcriptional regulator
MQRLRLKADGRIVELRDGEEVPLAPADLVDVMPTDVMPTDVMPADVMPADEMPVDVMPTDALPAGPVEVRDLRRRAHLTQLEFAAKLGVPVETIRNWEQGKRMPRGPARALLTAIAHAPDAVFAALAKA